MLPDGYARFTHPEEVRAAAARSGMNRADRRRAVRLSCIYVPQESPAYLAAVFARRTNALASRIRALEARASSRSKEGPES